MKPYPVLLAAVIAGALSAQAQGSSPPEETPSVTIHVPPAADGKTADRAAEPKDGAKAAEPGARKSARKSGQARHGNAHAGKKAKRRKQAGAQGASAAAAGGPG